MRRSSLYCKLFGCMMHVEVYSGTIQYRWMFRVTNLRESIFHPPSKEVLMNFNFTSSNRRCPQSPTQPNLPHESSTATQRGKARALISCGICQEAHRDDISWKVDRRSGAWKRLLEVRSNWKAGSSRRIGSDHIAPPSPYITALAINSRRWNCPIGTLGTVAQELHGRMLSLDREARAC